MKMKLTIYALFFSLLAQLTLQGSDDINLNRHQIFTGLELYHLHRNKEGGTKQQGNPVGIRLAYDRLKRYGWYWGVDFLYAHAKLHGHSGDLGASNSGGKLRSNFSDTNVEGRFGYTFQQKCGWQFAFTPFVGLGYYEEKNHFVKSSILPLHFRIHYPYVVAGFLSRIHLAENFEMGLNFKARYPWEPRCRVSKLDTVFSSIPDHVSQKIKERFQFRVELPLTYSPFCDPRIAISFVPFYEYRHFDFCPNFPFDFHKTQFTIYGAQIGVQYRI